MIAVGTVLADALVSGVFATPMSFANESETNTKRKQSKRRLGPVNQLTLAADKTLTAKKLQ